MMPHTLCICFPTFTHPHTCIHLSAPGAIPRDNRKSRAAFVARANITKTELHSQGSSTTMLDCLPNCSHYIGPWFRYFWSGVRYFCSDLAILPLGFRQALKMQCPQLETCKSYACLDFLKDCLSSLASSPARSAFRSPVLYGSMPRISVIRSRRCSSEKSASMRADERMGCGGVAARRAGGSGGGNGGESAVGLSHWLRLSALLK